MLFNNLIYVISKKNVARLLFCTDLLRAWQKSTHGLEE